MQNLTKDEYAFYKEEMKRLIKELRANPLVETVDCVLYDYLQVLDELQYDHDEPTSCKHESCECESLRRIMNPDTP